jgi:hypothetical protein
LLSPSKPSTYNLTILQYHHNSINFITNTNLLSDNFNYQLTHGWTPWYLHCWYR